MFDNLWWRYACSGTLISIYGIVSWRAGRHAPRENPALVPLPRASHLVSVVSILVFYELIRHTGGSLWGGWGNLVGVLLVFLTAAFRWRMRRGHPGLRYPGTIGRVVFDAALPLAVGTPWGWLALTAPAALLGIWGFQRDRGGELTPARHPAAGPGRSF